VPELRAASSDAAVPSTSSIESFGWLARSEARTDGRNTELTLG
jgi:hypothetical protein